MISLNFKNGAKTVRSNVVKNQMLSDPLFDAKVRLSVLESHLQHADLNVFPPYRQRELLESIGIIHGKNKYGNGTKRPI
jgi:hypothetical protein